MNNPWHGLRTYVEGETIYGRSEEIQLLTLLILQNKQSVIYGKSGIGKSSILNAGIFPKIRKKNVFPICIRLEHSSDIPYLEQIKNTIQEEIDKANGLIKIKEIVNKTLQETLWEFFHRVEYYNENGERIIPLLVFDQFEEIFTLENDVKKVNNFFRQMADVINNVMPDYLATSNTSDNSQQQNIDSGDFLDLGLDSLNLQTYAYEQELNVHIVFTLREDFLSNLERNTTDIPSLKNNRYCLQPINEEQAAQIILCPKPGLVSSDVAKLIIEKVTGEHDFEIDGIPEIQVDAAILSLYLNQLYQKMIEDDEDIISRRLVDTYSDNIIKDFYQNAISHLSGKCIDWLENTLVNEEGRRDNRDKTTVLKETGINDETLHQLIDEVKLLRQFSYGGNLRIEYIHDILCPIVVKNREYRQQRKLIEEESKKFLEQETLRSNRLKRRNKIMSYAILFLIVVCVIIGLIYMYQPKISKYSVLLSEDSSINLTDYWKARVTILSGKDTICSEEIDKSNPMFVFEVNDTGKDDMRYNVEFLIGDFGVNQISNNFNYSAHDIIIPISHTANRNLIKGVVASRIGSRAPVYDALVIIDDQLTKTNYKGEFSIFVDAQLEDSTIRIIKKGYKPFEGKLQRGVYRLSSNGDINYTELARSMQNKIDSAISARSMEGTFYGFENNDTLKGRAHMIVAVENDSIYGYTYYDKSYERVTNKVNSYFLINGKYNQVNNTFKLHLMDAVYNEVEYIGHVTDDSQWYGETFDKNKKLGYFVFK